MPPSGRITTRDWGTPAAAARQRACACARGRRSRRRSSHRTRAAPRAARAHRPRTARLARGLECGRRRGTARTVRRPRERAPRGLPARTRSSGRLEGTPASAGMASTSTKTGSVASRDRVVGGPTRQRSRNRNRAASRGRHVSPPRAVSLPCDDDARSRRSGQEDHCAEELLRSHRCEHTSGAGLPAVAQCQGLVSRNQFTDRLQDDATTTPEQPALAQVVVASVARASRLPGVADRVRRLSARARRAIAVHAESTKRQRPCPAKTTSAPASSGPRRRLPRVRSR